MAGNPNPIFSRVGDVEGSILLQNAAGDYNGQNANNQVVFQADPTNGGFIQRLRFKAAGTNIATVARIYINSGYLNLANTVLAVSGTPTGTPAGAGFLSAGNYFAKVQAVDQWGAGTPMSTETAAVAVTLATNNGSITWAWTGVSGAAKYRLFVGPATNSQVIYFDTGSNSNTYVQTTATVDLPNNSPRQGNPSDFLQQNFLYGEISLPATTASATAGTVDIDYPLNIALPPAYHIVVGLGAAVAAGWVVTGVGGSY